jgi:hypothetical protein
MAPVTPPPCDPTCADPAASRRALLRRFVACAGAVALPAAPPAAATGSGAAAPTTTTARTVVAPGRFSRGRPGGPLPAGWQRVPFNDRKRPTRYALVADAGTVVLEAEADASVSMVMREASIDLRHTPVVEWRWRVDEAPTGADNASASTEDAAARLLFAFAGDRSRLPLGDRATMRLARSLSGREMPYATLMYVTSSVADPGTVVRNPLSSRVRMVVAARLDAAAGGRWIDLSRNLAQDYALAFGEAPGRVLAFGVMTDADNTASRARALYGDIAFASLEGHR